MSWEDLHCKYRNSQRKKNFISYSSERGWYHDTKVKSLLNSFLTMCQPFTNDPILVGSKCALKRNKYIFLHYVITKKSNGVCKYV